MTDKGERPYDIVLWGSTGFAGQLVAEYLAEHYGDDLDWAIAGRNPDKLEQLRRDLTEIDSTLEDLPYLVGDAFDRGSLDELASQTDVVCTTVGPYDLYGSKLVAACVENQTDYCDLTGEVHWVREMIDKHQQKAEKDGTKIVHFCGFDSIPSDLGTQMVQDRAHKKYGRYCNDVRMYIKSMQLEPSGGTMASMMNAARKMNDSDKIRKLFADPYALNPEGENEGPDGPPQNMVRWDDRAEGWTAPFVMARTNEKVVRRTHALLDQRYGADFQYSECSDFGNGLGGLARAWWMQLMLVSLVLGLSTGVLRKALEKFVFPDPGEGPSRKAIEEGYFTAEVIGSGAAEDGDPFEVRATIGADRDPGYGATAIMLAESAICLANEPDAPLDGGILTPAAGLGTALADRLRDTEMTLEFQD